MKLLSRGNEGRKVGATDWVSAVTAFTDEVLKQTERSILPISLCFHHRYRVETEGRQQRR